MGLLSPWARLDEHGLVGLQVGLNRLDSSQLNGHPFGVQSAKMTVMSKSLANLQYFDVAIGELPNLSFGQLFQRTRARCIFLCFHSIIPTRKSDNPTR